MPGTQKSGTQEQPDAELQYTAKCIAMVVRNAMEDFHVRHLPDAHMAELNPIVHNAIYAALYSIKHSDDPEANGFMRFNELLIPSYWEPPKLLVNIPGTPTRATNDFAIVQFEQSFQLRK